MTLSVTGQAIIYTATGVAFMVPVPSASSAGAGKGKVCFHDLSVRQLVPPVSPTNPPPPLLELAGLRGDLVPAPAVESLTNGTIRYDHSYPPPDRLFEQLVDLGWEWPVPPPWRSKGPPASSQGIC